MGPRGSATLACTTTSLRLEKPSGGPAEADATRRVARTTLKHAAASLAPRSSLCRNTDPHRPPEPPLPPASPLRSGRAMDLAALRKPEAFTLEEALLRLRDGCADQGLRFLTALEPARAGGAPAILNVFVVAPLTGGVDLGPEALQAALRVVEATPYAGEPLPTPRPAAAAPPIVPEAAPSFSEPASAIDCTEGAPRELQGCTRPPLFRVAVTAAAFRRFFSAVAGRYGGFPYYVIGNPP